MTTAIPLPLPEGVRDLLGDLLSKTCAVDDIEERLALAPSVQAVIAEYIDPDGQIAGAAIADLSFACRSGSALVMMSPDVAEESLSNGEIDGDMLDCYREVVNVLSRLMNSDDTPEVNLRGIFQTGDLMPGGVRSLLRDSDHRRDYVVDIEEYGQGRLSVVTRATAA